MPVQASACYCQRSEQRSLVDKRDNRTGLKSASAVNVALIRARHIIPF